MTDTAFGIGWRTAATITSFFLFGVGALILSTAILPLLHLIYLDRAAAQRACRTTVRHSFRLFIWFMKTSGVLDCEISGQRPIPPGSLVVANHPSLIDIIFIMANVPEAHCVVKPEIDRNVLTRLIIKTTGYPTSDEPGQMIDECVRLIAGGATVVMFPEGTRTVPGHRPSFKRGAATILCHTLCPVTPVFLSISPPTLAKGDSWFKVPHTKVLFSMTVSEPIPASDLVVPFATERQKIRTCTTRLESLFSGRLSHQTSHQIGADEEHGKPPGGYQSTDREYSGT